MTLDQALSWDPVVDALAQQVPHYEPGSQHGYHATTYGWLVGEVIRRVTGKSVGTYFHDEIATPLGLDFWIGLPESEEPRVAPLVGGLADPRLAEDPEVARVRQRDHGSRHRRSARRCSRRAARSRIPTCGTRARCTRPRSRPRTASATRARSRACTRRASAPSTASASSTEEQLRRATTQLTTGPNTVLLDMDIQFGLGFMLRSSLIELGGPRSFGHFGAGGSVGWADPDAELAFGYVMNRMDMGLAGDVRSYELINACYAAIR